MTTPQDPFASPGGEPPASPPHQEPPAWQGQQFGMPPVPAGNRNGLGTAALVLGILSLVTWFLFVGGLFGIVAVILGVLGRGKAKRREASNGGMALGGIVTGAVGILLTTLVIVGVAALWNTEEFSNLKECVEETGGDQAAIDDCSRQFEDQLR